MKKTQAQLPRDLPAGGMVVAQSAQHGKVSVPSRHRPASTVDQRRRSSHLSFGFVRCGPRTILDSDQWTGFDHFSSHSVVRLALASGAELQILETLAERLASA